jgi:hypothetical protein
MKVITVIIAALGAFFLPIQGLIIAVGIAILFDTFTGIFKAVKLTGWKSVRSRNLSDLAGKALLYNLSIVMMFVVDVHLLSEFSKHWFSIEFISTKIISLVLVVVELTSIKENFEEAYKKDLWKMLKSLLQRSKEIKNDINEITN